MLRGRLIYVLMAVGLIAGGSGCSLVVPTKALKPVIRNPFPQLSRVAVAPFFNQSDEKTADGREFAMAYYAELQAVPGFEVVPVQPVNLATKPAHKGALIPAFIEGIILNRSPRTTDLEATLDAIADLIGSIDGLAFGLNDDINDRLEIDVVKPTQRYRRHCIIPRDSSCLIRPESRMRAQVKLLLQKSQN